MSKENEKRTGKTSSWSTLRRHLMPLDKPVLLALVKELYEVCGSNRDFIQARCQGTLRPKQDSSSFVRSMRQFLGRGAKSILSIVLNPTTANPRCEV